MATNIATKGVEMEFYEYKQTAMVTCDSYLLSDLNMKNFLDLLNNPSLDDSKPALEPALTLKQQLTLVRSCMADILYSIHFLGLWGAKMTTRLYLTEFSRLSDSGIFSVDLISAATTVLNNVFNRLEAIMSLQSGDDLILQLASPKLLFLLDAIKEYKPPVNNNRPFCIIQTKRRVIAKVIALWLNKVASSHDEYSYIKPNYIVGSTRKHSNRMTVDNFDLHHEASIRDFRFGNCNVLVSSVTSDRGTELPRCNLVVSFDLPAKFSDFAQAKGYCRYESSKYVVLFNKMFDDDAQDRLISFINTERQLNIACRRTGLEPHETAILEQLDPIYGSYPKNSPKNPATVWRGLSIINKYCAKLPSDSFTKLSPEWVIKELVDNGERLVYCEMRLPINSPVRQTIIGPPAPTRNIAIRLAAFTACQVLHKSGELDDNMMPITKESMRMINPLARNREPGKAKARGAVKGQSMGSTKRRQYYSKRVAKVFSGPLVKEGVRCNLYKFKMVLNCPIPDEQNRRGRRIIDPSETNRNYAIVCSSDLPNVCSFPLFTRSGEVIITVELVKCNIVLNSSQVEDLRNFHEFTFSKVLKLEKYPIIFDPDNSQFTVLLAPVIDLAFRTEIDWEFVQKILYKDQESYVPTLDERKTFEFKHEDYVDAVVIPWYRLTDRQQYAYYVAEICEDLNPDSPFPDEDSGFATFVDYYQSKYDIEIFNKKQPILDVDHTSARLNLLTPRYVNRKGRTLPSSTAKTRRESRESLVQKQLLIPELCSIHPFPASFWRKAVCLPCIFYRLNSLFLAEELRRQVANDTRVGFVEPPKNFEWQPLNFGWSLKDVITCQTGTAEESPETGTQKEKAKNVARTERKLKKKVKTIQAEQKPSSPPPEADGDFVIDTFDPSKYDIPDIPLDAPEQDWANIKLISSGKSSSGQATSGWDQPLEQQDLFLEHINEATWSDCELEFDGEITEKVAQMRCGSPSAFEPGQLGSSQEIFQYSSANESSEKVVKFSENYKSRSDERRPAMRKFELDPNTDSSWSSLSEGEEEDEESVESSGSEPVVCHYGEWKDSKTKNQPLLRELFIPISRTGNSASSDSTKMDDKLTRNGVADKDLSESNISKLEAKVIYDSNDQMNLEKLLSENFAQRLSFDELEIKRSILSNYEMILSLDAKVESALNNNPDLFKDNGLELVAVDDSFTEFSLEVQPAFGELLPDRNVETAKTNEEWKSIKFDPTLSEIDSNGPGPNVILQALTMSNASDGINLERLETVGDSFLKYSITTYLYCTRPSLNEGKLSFLRSLEISNANLYQLGCSRNFGELMSATKFEPNDNWLAPGYTVADSAPITDGDDNKKREIDKALAEVPYDLLVQHSIPDKSIADCVEALIGAYLTASGSRAALLFMRWLRLNVIPESFDLEADCARNRDGNSNEIWRWLEIPPSPLIATPPTYSDNAHASLKRISEAELRQNAIDELNRLYIDNNLARFEKELNYQFKDKAYLVQAFSHNSFYENHVTDCHQRLEFLGDAILDYLITRYLFEDPRCHSPGTLTDLRSALVNNTFFASLAVKYNFHEYLMFKSDDLQNVIDGFVKKLRLGSKGTILKGYTLLVSEGESEYAEDIEVPKALGDVFESVAGAIFLDSGLSLDQVWQVYFEMMKPEVEYFSINVPKSPIRELLESMPQNVRFSPSELAPDRKHRVIAEVFGLGRFIGVGRNKHSAKSTAAKRALRMLALRRKEMEQKNGFLSQESVDDPKLIIDESE